MTEAATLAGPSSLYAQRKAEAQALAADILAGLTDYPGIQVEARDRRTVIFVVPANRQPFAVPNETADTVDDLVNKIKRRLGAP